MLARPVLQTCLEVIVAVSTSLVKSFPTLFAILLFCIAYPGAASNPVIEKVQWWWGPQPQPQPHPGYYPQPQPGYYPQQPQRRRQPERQRPRETRKPQTTPKPTPRATPRPRPRRQSTTPQPQVDQEQESDERQLKRSSTRRRDNTISPGASTDLATTDTIDLDSVPETVDADVEQAPPSANPVENRALAAARTGSATARTVSEKTQLLPVPEDWPPPPAPTPLPINDGHTVIVFGNGDSLNRIAAACGTTADQILKDNKLTYATLREGQALRIPAPTSDASTFEPSQQLRREVWRGVRGRKQIALTFDAGGEDDGAVDLLSHLKEADVAASFFVTGDFTRKNPQIIKDMAASNYPIYNHSWTHPPFTRIPASKMDEELGKTDEMVKQVVGKTTRPYWRPPFGDRDSRVLAATGDLGYQSIYWTLDSLDSVGESKDPEFVVNRIINPPQAKGHPEAFLDGAIVLMHVGKTGTAQALPEIIRELQRMGFTLVTVEDILKP